MANSASILRSEPSAGFSGSVPNFPQGEIMPPSLSSQDVTCSLWMGGEKEGGREGKKEGENERKGELM
jgi:hypothetical protein